ncbi:hypothetical protein [Bacillus sp. TH13]|uniref:hypothetical protein n=1 Tax=Bacillus sp. TH13 TaxID=2796379 RepID=UPI001911DA30|nr:hypothetical protein [Bacillus sp. TH13]MBK5491663.1 hypothetical protein [Bacillus sp. TH13]
MGTVTNHVLSQINAEWQQQGNDAYAFLTNVLICPFLYKQLEDEGILEKQTDQDEEWFVFDPNKFNSIEDGNYFEILIYREEIDELITYEFE